MFFTNRTDLAVEFSKKRGADTALHTVYELYGIKITETVLDKKTGEAVGKPAGRYFTIGCSDPFSADREIYALSAVLRKILPVGRCLAVGLGNPSVAADSLGWETAGRILATSQFIKNGMEIEGMGDISVIRTNVSANSGIESTLQTRLCADGAGADYVIAIDSLACNSVSRLCRTMQITDAGIVPGSGAGNPRKRLDKETAGVPVIAIGVPTAMEYSGGGEKLMVTKSDIDCHIRRYARVISSAINRTLSPALSEEDCRVLMCC